MPPCENRGDNWWVDQDSNLGQLGYEPRTLPAELPTHLFMTILSLRR